MIVGCNCGSKAGVAYQVTFGDNTTQTYATASEAIAALDKRGVGGTYKAVAK